MSGQPQCILDRIRLLLRLQHYTLQTEKSYIR
jgi:hypothetical protein